ncbi:hypothetical protein [Aquibacillus rhizosphaerae]|uniref:Uncharacterized protein n=1 Tax=Aquibacillus rhizosphaerae TaxID=3051431 RepID=A0ABT7L7C2_9BACI|nr:hypothetical protein [Aquibacillus sp. LR5S19]MDL4841764.1 hypothetical protein [Aquibacillus sp. LR5S19]
MKEKKRKSLGWGSLSLLLFLIGLSLYNVVLKERGQLEILS